MKIFEKLGSVTIAALLVVGAMASTSSAAFDAAEAKCRAAISKNFTKAISQGNKAISGCHKDRDSGKVGLAVDCNVLNNTNADVKGKFAKAQAKLASGVQKSCIDSLIDQDAMSDYVSCPEPCSTDLALPNPMTSYANLSSCLQCVAGDIAENYGLATQGLPAATLTGDDLACANAIGKNYGKLLSTIMKERTKCQNTAEKKEGAMSLADTGCATADPKLKIAGATTKAQDAILASCGTANLTNVDSCDTTSTALLNTCLGTETNDAGDDGVSDSYELAPNICPIGIDSLVLAKTSQALGATSTALELGWTGVAHLADLPDNYFISVDVTCPNSSPPCGSCTIDGISSTGQQYASFTRCSNDFTIECDEPFGPDVDDCGGNVCNYVLGPPLPISAGNNPTCSINRLQSDVTGTSDPDAGIGEIQLNLSTLVYLGEGLANPCPVCENDTTPLDGIKNGTCSGGANDGDPCDVMGFSATFANPANDQGLSLDCPSEQLANISGSGLVIPLELTTGSTSLPFANACDSPLGFLDCACGVCSGDTTLPCVDDQTCIDAGAGTCTSIGSGVSRVPNACNDGVCSVLSGETGTCLAGPDDLFCDGLLDAQNDGFIGCNSNADCTAVASVCGGNCGTCTISRERACFLDPIDATGTPDTDNPVLVSTFCLPPTNNAAINGVTGSPGPVRVAVEQLTDLRY